MAATDADMWTGHAYAKDYTVRAELTPMAGTSHLVTARARGTSQFYGAGFEQGKLVIISFDFGAKVIAETSFEMELGRRYDLAFDVSGDDLTLYVDGKKALNTTDQKYQYGMAGLRLASAGRLLVTSFAIEEK